MRYESPVAAYLAQARQIDGLIKATLEQIVQLRASITRGTAMLSDMPRGRRANTVLVDIQEGIKNYC